MWWIAVEDASIAPLGTHLKAECLGLFGLSAGPSSLTPIQHLSSNSSGVGNIGFSSGSNGNSVENGSSNHMDVDRSNDELRESPSSASSASSATSPSPSPTMTPSSSPPSCYLSPSRTAPISTSLSSPTSLSISRNRNSESSSPSIQVNN